MVKQAIIGVHDSAVRRKLLVLGPIRWLARSVPMPKGRYRCFRFIYRSVLRHEDAELTLRLGVDGRVKLRMGESLAHEVIYWGAFERIEIDYAAEVLEQMPRDQRFFVDIGANVGLFSIAMATVSVEVRGVACEPMESSLRRLREHLDISAVADRVQVVPHAVGPFKGDAVLLSSSPDGAFAHFGPARGPEVPDTIPVRMTTLDELWDQCGRPLVSLLKVDIEGGESQVIRSGRRLIDHCSPKIIVEAHDGPAQADLQRLADELGYRVSSPKGFKPWNFLLAQASQRLQK